MKIEVLGARGSMAVSGKQYQEFGGGTTCFLVETETEAIFLDAGSGMLNCTELPEKRISVFLTHSHLDHLLGLPLFPMMFEKNREITLFGKKRNGMSVKEQVDSIYSKPAWPVQMEEYPSKLRYQDLMDEEGIRLLDVKISWMEGNHPDGSLIYKIEGKNASMVFATDYEHDLKTDAALIAFAKDCDLFICDGQYTKEEYEKKRGFGHTTMEHAVELFEATNAKQLLITHHNPHSDDGMLLEKEKELQKGNKRIRFARAGEVIEL